MFESPRLNEIDKITIRNYFMNSDFRYWQRAFSSLIGNGGFEYVADRWGVGPGLDGVAGSQTTFSRSTDTPDDKVSYSLQAVGAYVPGEEISFIHRVEDIFATDLSNGKGSFRIYYNTDGADSIEIRLEEAAAPNSFGGTNNIRFQTTTSPVADGTWQEILLENIDLASCDNGLQLHMVFRSGITGTVTNKIAKGQLNKGETLKPYTLFGRDTVEELIYCQRYYEKSGNIDVPPTTPKPVSEQAFAYRAKGSSSGEVPAFHSFGIRKRITPIVTFFSSSGNPDRMNDQSGSQKTVVYYGSTEYSFSGSTNQVLVNGNNYYWDWTADAEL